MGNTNTDVIQAFLDGKPKQGANLSTDGITLWSYYWWQVATHTDPNTITVRNGPAYSLTTAKHRSRLYSLLRFNNNVAQSELTPASLGPMRLPNQSQAERVANGGFSTEHYRSY